MMRRLAAWLIARAKRTPYFHIQGPDGATYMERYWLVPYAQTEHEGCYVARWYRNPLVWLLQRFDIAIRIHHIRRPDNDRHMHDHPWNFISVVLEGLYVEARPMDLDYAVDLEVHTTRYPGAIGFRRAGDRHRITQVSPGGVVTLFITFKYQQGWGFYTPEGKVPYREYLANKETTT